MGSLQRQVTEIVPRSCTVRGMARLELEVSGGVMRALREIQNQTGRPLDRIVDTLLSDGLDVQQHSIFQVSTSNALVKGVFEGSVTVGDLRQHGNFGLGTFDSLDGEMVMVDGRCFRAAAGGQAVEVSDDEEVPFALVTRFVPDVDDVASTDSDWAELTGMIDNLRPSSNLFVAFRVDGDFEELSMRAICRARQGEGLVEATAHQSEFTLGPVSGSLVGFWAPEYARAISVPGYHAHFISDDRRTGGHVMGLSGTDLAIQMHTETDLHLSLPESEEFLAADLRGDFAEELDQAETVRHSG